MRTTALAALMVLSSAAVATAADDPTAQMRECAGTARRMSRADLFFGAARVPPKTWARFLATAVTPRFPDGLTTYEGRGQWRGAHGLVVEPAHILIIYYRPDARSDAKIDAIRTAYKTRFRQSSVLRADSSACVSF